MTTFPLVFPSAPLWSAYGRRSQVRYKTSFPFLLIECRLMVGACRSDMEIFHFCFARRCVNFCWVRWCLRRCLRKVGSLRLACVFSVCSRVRLFVCVEVCEALSSPGDVSCLRSVAKYSLVRVPVAERASGSAVLSVFLRGFQSCRRLGACTAIFMRSVSRSRLCFDKLCIFSRGLRCNRISVVCVFCRVASCGTSKFHP